MGSLEIDMVGDHPTTMFFTFTIGTKSYPLLWQDLKQHTQSNLYSIASWAISSRGEFSSVVDCDEGTFEIIYLYLKTKRLFLPTDLTEFQTEKIYAELMYRSLEDAALQLLRKYPLHSLQGLVPTSFPQKKTSGESQPHDKKWKAFVTPSSQRRITDSDLKIVKDGWDRKLFYSFPDSQGKEHQEQLCRLFDEKGKWTTVTKEKEKFVKYTSLRDPTSQPNEWVSTLAEFHQNLRAYSLGIVPALMEAFTKEQKCKLILAGGCVLACLKKWKPQVLVPHGVDVLYALCQKKKWKSKKPSVEQLFAQQMLTGAPLPLGYKKRIQDMNVILSEIFEEDEYKRKIDEFPLLFQPPRKLEYVKDEKNQCYLTYDSDDDLEPDSPPPDEVKTLTYDLEQCNDLETLATRDTFAPHEREAFELLDRIKMLEHGGSATPSFLPLPWSSTSSQSSLKEKEDIEPPSDDDYDEEKTQVRLMVRPELVFTIRPLPRIPPMFINAKKRGNDHEYQHACFAKNQLEWSRYLVGFGDEQAQIRRCANMACGRTPVWCDNGQLQWDVSPDYNNMIPREEESWRTGDIDFFLICSTQQDAEEALFTFERVICECVVPAVGKPTFARSKCAISVMLPTPYRPCQIILRTYSCMEQVLIGFDWDVCQVGFALDQPTNVWATPAAVRAISTGQMILDVTRQSETFELRAAKYARRGFEIAIPSIVADDVLTLFTTSFHNTFSETTTMKQSGLLQLLFLLAENKRKHNSNAERKSDYGILPCLKRLSKSLLLLGGLPYHSVVATDMKRLLKTNQFKWQGRSYLADVPLVVDIPHADGNGSFCPRFDPFWFPLELPI